MTSELTKAHAKFIKTVGTIQETENNDFHHSKYASLEGVLSVVNPVLADCGLSIFQIFDHSPEGQTILKTILRHESGEELNSCAIYPSTAGKNPLHEWGKNCTYMRRYTLLAILGICAGIEDNDGNLSSVPEEVTVTQPLNNQVHKGYGKRLASSDKIACLENLKEFVQHNSVRSNELQRLYCNEFLGGKGLDDKGFWTKHLNFEPQVQFILDFINQNK